MRLLLLLLAICDSELMDINVIACLSCFCWLSFVSFSGSLWKVRQAGQVSLCIPIKSDLNMKRRRETEIKERNQSAVRVHYSSVRLSSHCDLSSVLIEHVRDMIPSNLAQIFCSNILLINGEFMEIIKIVTRQMLGVKKKKVSLKCKIMTFYDPK